MYDIVYRNAEVVDGTGSPRFKADVAISGDTISAVETSLDGAEARTTIEGSGRVLAPGFIDLHTHSDFNLLVDPRGESKIRQGVTTEVVGNCGGWAAPLRGEGLTVAREQLAQLGVSDKIAWSTMGEYLDLLEDQGVCMNVASLVGHGAIRAAVLGYENRKATASEMRAMKDHLHDALQSGSFGMSTGIYYAPGNYASTEELILLSEVVAQHNGMHATHIRDESDYSIGLMAAVDEVIDIAEQSGVSMQISHLKALGPAVWGRSSELLERIEGARDRGIEIGADQYPYVASGSSITGALIPRWAQIGGRKDMLDRIDDPCLRRNLVLDVEANLKRRGGAERLLIARYPPRPALEGKTLQEAATMMETSAAEAALRLLTRGDASFVSFVMQPDDVDLIMKADWVAVASDGRAVATDGPLSAGHPHPRYFGTFPRVLGSYCRERSVLTLEEAVRKMTSLPADKLGLADRGRLQPGMAADLVLFNPETIGDCATFEKPQQYPMGVDSVLVNGQFVVTDGTHSNSRAGRILRRG